MKKVCRTGAVLSVFLAAFLIVRLSPGAHAAPPLDEKEAKTIQELSAQLASPDEKVRNEAAGRLAGYREKALEEVLAALGKAQARGGAIAVFERWNRDANAMQALAEGYAGPDKAIAEGARAALEKIGLPGIDVLARPLAKKQALSPAAEKAFGVALASYMAAEDEKGREDVVVQISRRGYLVPVLLSLFPDAGPALRENLVNALGRQGRDTIAALGEALDDPDKAAAQGARDSLAASCEGMFLLKALGVPGREIRYSGNVPALGEQGKKLAREALDRMPPYLIAHLDNPNKGRRDHYATILKYIGSPAAKPLVAATDDQDPIRAQAAQAALVSLGEDSVPALVAVAGSEAAEAAIARDVLRQIGWKALSALQKTQAPWASEVEISIAVRLAKLSNWYPGLEENKKNLVAAFRKALREIEALQDRLELAIALGEMGYEDGLPELIKGLSDPELDPNLRWRCAWSLGRTKALPEVADALNKAVADTAVDVRHEAALSLGRLRCREALGALYELYQHDSDAGVRYAARWAMQRITGEEFGDDRGRWGEYFKAHPPTAE